MGGADEVRFVVVDVETTGLQPRTERIIEIAIALMDTSGWVSDEWATLIRPDDRELTGRLAALEDAPTFREVAGEICHRLSRGVVTGHNVLFDLRFIDAELRRIGERLPGLDYLDTHAVATTLSVDTPNRSLAVLCHAMDVPFTQWHTAEGDVAATAKLLARLLERARAWGQTDHELYLRVWDAPGEEFPTLERSDCARRRDPLAFPPAGKQPSAPSVSKPSWRRAGTGPSSGGGAGSVSVTIGIDDDQWRKLLVDAATKSILAWTAPEWPEGWSDDMRAAADVVRGGGPEAQDAALVFWYLVAERRRAERSSAEEAAFEFDGGDFRGMEGITELERITGVLADDGGHDAVLARALAALADLYRRHGGRHDDVVAAYRRAFDAGARACLTTEPRWETFDDDEHEDSTPGTGDGFWSDDGAEALDDVLTGWWGYHETRRESAALAALFELLHSPGLRLRYVTAAELASTAVQEALRRGELVVARDILTAVLPVVTADDDPQPICAAVERVANALAVQGDTDEALAWCERAWSEGWADQRVANRHSLILERAARWNDAIAVATRGCELVASEYNDALAKRVVRCGKKLDAPAGKKVARRG